MELQLEPKPFNVKRPGSLAGTISGVIERLTLLYKPLEASSSAVCPNCNGSGTVAGEIDPKRMLATELSLKKGAVLLWAGTNCAPVPKIQSLARMIGIDADKPLAEQAPLFTDILLHGYDQEPVRYVFKKKEHLSYYRGCVSDLKYMRDAGTTSKGNLRAIRLFSHPERCPACSENRLGKERLLHGKSLSDVLGLPFAECLEFVRMQGAGTEGDMLQELQPRLVYLNKIGLKSLSMFADRASVRRKGSEGR